MAAPLVQLHGFDVKAYIPIPNNSIPDQRTIESLLLQGCEVEVIECGELRDTNDRNRYIDIGKGRIEAMKRAVKSGEKYFVINNAGALHKNEYGIERCIIFLKDNIDFAGVSLPKKRPVRLEQAHVTQECTVYRTEAIKDLENFIKWDTKTCECVKIRNAIVKYKNMRFGYLEKNVNHLQDIGRGFAIKDLNGTLCN